MQAPGFWWYFKSYCVPPLRTRLLEMCLNSLIHMYSVTVDWQWKESTCGWICLADDKDSKCLPFSYSFKSTITISSPSWVMVYPILTTRKALVTSVELSPLVSMLPWNWVLKTACSPSRTDISFVKHRQINWSECVSKINQTFLKKIIWLIMNCPCSASEVLSEWAGTLPLLALQYAAQQGRGFICNFCCL